MQLLHRYAALPYLWLLIIAACFSGFRLTFSFQSVGTNLLVLVRNVQLRQEGKEERKTNYV